MRDLAILLAVLVGAALVAVVSNKENWLGDQPGLVVMIYLGVVLVVIGLWTDLQALRRPR